MVFVWFFLKLGATEKCLTKSRRAVTCRQSMSIEDLEKPSQLIIKYLWGKNNREILHKTEKRTKFMNSI